MAGGGSLDWVFFALFSPLSVTSVCEYYSRLSQYSGYIFLFGFFFFFSFGNTIRGLFLIDSRYSSNLFFRGAFFGGRTRTDLGTGVGVSFGVGVGVGVGFGVGFGVGVGVFFLWDSTFKWL